MTTQPQIPGASRRQLHHIQIKLAFGDNPDHPARPATLVRSDGDTIHVRYLDGSTGTGTVGDEARLADVLARLDLCRLQGRPLLLVNTYYGVVGIATGPATAPSRLEVLCVSRMEDGTVVELVGGDDVQPNWQVLALG